jgi:hypothetical protein
MPTVQSLQSRIYPDFIPGMVLKMASNLTSVMVRCGDSTPPKRQAPCIMCGLQRSIPTLPGGCHTISPERILCDNSKNAVFH